MERSRLAARMAGSSTARLVAVLTALSLVMGALLGGGSPLPPSLSTARDVVTPKQRTGSAKGRSHAASAQQTTAKGDGTRRVPRRPKGAPPLEQPFTPRVVTKTAAKRPRPPESAKGSQVRTASRAEPEVKGFDPKASVEDPAQRTRYGYRYRNPDGTWTLRESTRPVNYRAADGSWQPIDSRLVDTGRGRWRNRADASQVDFAGQGSAQDLTVIGLGPGRRFGFGVGGAGGVVAQVRGDQISYPGIRADADLQLQVLNGGNVKEQIVLRSPNDQISS